MKRYALFAWTTYEEAGGWGDFINSFDSIDDARAHEEWRRAVNDSPSWSYGAEIIDLQTGERVDQS